MIITVLYHTKCQSRVCMCGGINSQVRPTEKGSRGHRFDSWLGLASLGKALCTTFLTPPRCKNEHLTLVGELKGSGRRGMRSAFKYCSLHTLSPSPQKGNRTFPYFTEGPVWFQKGIWGRRNCGILLSCEALCWQLL